jgi:hypothetical protein
LGLGGHDYRIVNHPFTDGLPGHRVPPEILPETPMPKIPDMSAAAVKSRAALSKKAIKPKEATVAPAPKPRMAKRR